MYKKKLNKLKDYKKKINKICKKKIKFIIKVIKNYCYYFFQIYEGKTCIRYTYKEINQIIRI